MRTVFGRYGFHGILDRIFLRVWHVYFLVCKWAGVKYVLSRYGIKLVSNFTDRTYYFYIVGKYGFRYWNWISSKNEPFIYFDIGANQGLYSICAAKNEKCLKCFAFEPVVETYKKLENNILLNSANNKCRTVNKAISNEEGSKEILIDSGHSGKATIRQVEAPDRNFEEVQQVVCINRVGLNKLMKDFQGAFISIKIDVEGHELVVLEELFETDFAKQITEIFYEIDQEWAAEKEIEKLLIKNNFGLIKYNESNSAHYDVLAIRKDAHN